jgi:hypothetical protein
MEIASMVVFVSGAGILLGTSAACMLALPAVFPRAHRATEHAPVAEYAPVRLGTDAALFNTRVIQTLRKFQAWRRWEEVRDQMFALPDGPAWRQHREALKLYPEALVKRVLREVRMQMYHDGELPPPGLVSIDTRGSVHRHQRQLRLASLAGHTRS